MLFKNIAIYVCYNVIKTLVNVGDTIANINRLIFKEKE